MWDAAACLSLSFTALTQVEPGSVKAQQLTEVLALLPASLEQLPQHEIWKQKQQVIISSIVKGFADVYALVTSKDQLLGFRNLPFIVVKAWAAFDGLLVDSEDSVAVALNWWVKGQEGLQCSKQQLQDLARMVRVQHMNPGMCRPWFCSSELCSGIPSIRAA
jgi:hypothetical protein